MTTRPAQEVELPRKLAKDKPKPFLRRTGSRLERYFEMPPTDVPTLPELWIAQTRLASWPLASLATAAGFYSLFLVLAYLDGYMAELSARGEWWFSLTMPVLMSYLFLIQPFLRRQLTQAIHVFQAKVPFNEHVRRLELRAHSLNRRLELFAVGVAILTGWLVLEPPLANSYPSAIFYDLVGDIFVFGLLGWHIYAGLARTKLLANMHGYVQNLNLLRDPITVKPLFQWSLSVVSCLAGAILVSAIFIPSSSLLNSTTMVIYAFLGLVALLVIVFSKVPQSLVSQFRIIRAMVLFMTLAGIGTVGFNRLEGWPLLNAFYATIITMATVGYGDYTPETAHGQIFTVFLTLFAVGIGGYALTSVASFVIEGNFQRFIQGRRVDKQIDQMNNHYILCGAGHLGRQIAAEFYKSQVPFVVIEAVPHVLEELLREMEVPYVQADATQDESLRLAGVERAKGLVTTFSDDKDNVFVTLSARSLSPDLHIMSQVSWEKNIDKLKKAGANVVISPSAVSGRRMVSEMLSLEVVTLLDEMLRAEQHTGQVLRLEEVHVDEIKIPALVERLDAGELCITDIGQRTELLVVAIERALNPAGDRYIYTPRGNTRLQRGDVLIVVGTPEQRLQLDYAVLSQRGLRDWFEELWV
jgi:voltage-gated potassium channel